MQFGSSTPSQAHSNAESFVGHQPIHAHGQSLFKSNIAELKRYKSVAPDGNKLKIENVIDLYQQKFPTTSQPSMRSSPFPPSIKRR